MDTMDSQRGGTGTARGGTAASARGGTARGGTARIDTASSARMDAARAGSAPPVYKEGHDTLGIITGQDDIPEEYIAEDLNVFRSGWQQQRICSKADWRSSSLSVWPDIEHVVILKRLDVFVCESPPSQQASTDEEESRLIR